LRRRVWRRRGPKRLALRHDDDCTEVVDVDYVADNLTYRIDDASEKAPRYIDYARHPTSHNLRQFRGSIPHCLVARQERRSTHLLVTNHRARRSPPPAAVWLVLGACERAKQKPDEQ